MPKYLKDEAKKLNISMQSHVSSSKELKDTIFGDHWRQFPMLANIPASSQLFGQMVFVSSIQAILYPSQKRKGNKCLAIFPNNFLNSYSYVKIQDDCHNNVKIASLDANTFNDLIKL